MAKNTLHGIARRLDTKGIRLDSNTIEALENCVRDHDRCKYEVLYYRREYCDFSNPSARLSVELDKTYYHDPCYMITYKDGKVSIRQTTVSKARKWLDDAFREEAYWEHERQMEYARECYEEEW